MKTQISGNSFDAEKQYSGVYFQQGRMLLDADWNEQVALTQNAQREGMADVIGSGIPKEGGVQFATAGTLSAGVFYADGQRVEVKDPIALAPWLPAIPNDQHLRFVADVYEREVTAVEDPDLQDPALYGADTCTRMKPVVQLRWMPVAVYNALQATGGSQCQIDALADADPMLMRVEIHEVDFVNRRVVVKWSSENGAEQFAVGAVPSAFSAGNHVYEFFSSVTDDSLGLQFPGCQLQRPRLTTSIADNPMSLSFVRRWDGYAEIGFAQVTATGLANGSLSNCHDCNVALDSGLGPDVAGGISYNASSNTLKVNLGSVTVAVKLDPDALQVGDYWLAKVRESSTTIVNQELPCGYRHRYLLLGTKAPSGAIAVVDSQPYSFPKLTSLASEDIAGQGGKTVEEELQALADKDAEQDARLDTCEQEIEKLKEQESRDLERLTLWGRGVVAGFIPPPVVVKVLNAAKKWFSVDLEFAEPAGTLIDGKGALWIDEEVAPRTIYCDGVFSFLKSAQIKAVLKEKYGVSRITFKLDLAGITLFTDQPVAIFAALRACADYDMEKLLGHDSAFDPKDFLKVDSEGIAEMKIFVYPTGGSLKILGAVLGDESNKLDVFTISRDIEKLMKKFPSGRISRSASGIYPRAAVLESFKMVAEVERKSVGDFSRFLLWKPAVESEYDRLWKKYEAYSRTMQPNNGQVCIGTLAATVEDALITPENREQVITSPLLQSGWTLESPSVQDDGTETDTGRYDVGITAVGANKVRVVEAVRKAAGVSLAEAKAMVDSGSFTVAGNVSRTAADAYREALASAGATVELVKTR